MQGASEITVEFQLGVDLDFAKQEVRDKVVRALGRTGKPAIRGTRLSVEFILDLLASGKPEAEVLGNYPGITREDVLACLSYASYLAHECKAYPIPA